MGEGFWGSTCVSTMFAHMWKLKGGGHLNLNCPSGTVTVVPGGGCTGPCGQAPNPRLTCNSIPSRGRGYYQPLAPHYVVTQRCEGSQSVIFHRLAPWGKGCQVCGWGRLHPSLPWERLAMGLGIPGWKVSQPSSPPPPLKPGAPHPSGWCVGADSC